MWHMTRDKWHLTHWGGGAGGEPSLKISSQTKGQKDCWLINQFINDKGVCRTAPSIQGGGWTFSKNLSSSALTVLD